MSLRKCLSSLGVTIALMASQTCSRAQAHDVRAHESGKTPQAVQNWHELAWAWEFDPLVVVPMVISAGLYIAGTRRLWREAGVGRGIHRRDAWCFTLGWLSLVVALISPLHPWGTALFSAHMTQHEILMLVSAPLMVLGRPMIPFLTALPVSWRKALSNLFAHFGASILWSVVTNPFVAWLVHAATLWVWHLPALFDAANRNDAVHALQHISFFGTALLFWWSLLQAPRRVTGFGIGVLYLLTTAIHSGLLGALITFASRVWYPSYLTTTQSWGLTPLEDQQLGGLIMWIPACTVYLVAGLALLRAWMAASNNRVRRWQSEHAFLPAQPLRQTTPAAEVAS